MRIRGSGTYTDANGKVHKIIGIGELPDSENLQELKVSGNLSFKKISCNKINVSGKCNGSSIAADYLKTSGELSVDDVSCNEVVISGKFTGDTVNAKNFSGSGKVEVGTLTIERVMNLSGKPQINSLSAYEIIIASSDGSIDKVTCRHIKIFDNDNFDISHSRVRIEKIDADTVELENCAVDVIKCRDAVIGKNCAIEKLFISGECKVADDSSVGETIRA
ncbi:MAG: hypothetical protein IJ685_08375 [Selenomonadaceae bacterium]|nr:hypothetical protein [Selenomonadaceae bacterium]